MGKGKGAFKNDMKRKFGSDYLVLHHNPNIDKKNLEEHIKKNNSETSNQIASTYAMNPAYDLDFEDETFGHIFLKELRNKGSKKNIQLFFEDLKKVKEVIMTVENMDDPRFEKLNDGIITHDEVKDPHIEEKTMLILEFPTYKRQISARFFWALLPKDKTAPYVEEYYDHYQRLTYLFLDLEKEVLLDEY